MVVVVAPLGATADPQEAVAGLQLAPEVDRGGSGQEAGAAVCRAQSQGQA